MTPVGRLTTGMVAGWNALVLAVGLIAAVTSGTSTLDVAAGAQVARPGLVTSTIIEAPMASASASSSTTTSIPEAPPPSTTSPTTAPPLLATTVPPPFDSHGPTATVVEGDGSPLPPGTITSGNVAVSGVIRDGAGQPVGGICVEVDGSEEGRAHSAPDGSFAFTFWQTGYESPESTVALLVTDCSGRWPGYARQRVVRPGSYSLPVVENVTVTPGAGVIAPLAPNHGPGAPDVSMAGGCLVLRDGLGMLNAVIDPTGTLVAGGLVPGYVDLVGACTPGWAVQQEGPGMPGREPIPPGGVATITTWFVTPPGSLGSPG
jgi:hypothetical protein